MYQHLLEQTRFHYSMGVDLVSASGLAELEHVFELATFWVEVLQLLCLVVIDWQDLLDWVAVEHDLIAFEYVVGAWAGPELVY